MENLNKETWNDKLPTQSVAMSTSDLTYNQKQKYAVLRKYYPNEADALKLTRLIEGKGENSYKAVLDKIKNIQRFDRPTSQFHDAMYDQFQTDIAYTFDDIIGDVSEIRADHDLLPYTSRMKQNCEKDLVSLFIVKSVYKSVEVVDTETGELKVKKTHIGYIPLFKLKPEDEI